MTSFQKILIATVIILVIFNSILLGFIWLNRPGRPEGRFRQGPPDRESMEITGRRLLSELDFTEEQAPLFRREARNHLNRMNDISSKLRRSKHQINKAILTEDTRALAQADSIHAMMQKRLNIESREFIRFLDSVCTPQQRKKLIEMNEDMIRRRH